MSKEKPVLIREFLKGQTLRDWQLNFKALHYLPHQHKHLIHALSQQVFKVPLSPTHSEYRVFRNGEGKENLHYDTLKKFCSVEICLNHKRPWPLFINHQREFQNTGREVSELQLTSGEIEEAKSFSSPFLLNPGDALFYCGFNYLHWREAIEAGNFCEMAFFHFESRN